MRAFYFWNSSRQVLFFSSATKDGFGVNVSSWLLQLLIFICQFRLQFVVCICTNCIVSFLLQTNRMADVLPANLYNFCKQKASDRPHYIQFFFWFGHSLNTLQIRSSICRLHFKWFVEICARNSTAFKKKSISELFVLKWPLYWQMNDVSITTIRYTFRGRAW